MATEAAVLCLIPARNAAEDLSRALRSAAMFADGVLALDDGSTDDTSEVLRGAAVVVDVLTNPVRPDYRGWNDSANRQRLLDAAAAFSPTWIVWLDADEAIAADDAAAFRHFLETDAIAGCAYGLRHHWMSGEHLYRPPVSWVYRAFAYVPGGALPERRLHFEPVPDSIPRKAWVRTTIRLQHFGLASPESRAARVRKYAEADPEGHFFDGREPQGTPTPWGPRAAELPVLWSP